MTETGGKCQSPNCLASVLSFMFAALLNMGLWPKIYAMPAWSAVLVASVQGTCSISTAPVRPRSCRRGERGVWGLGCLWFSLIIIKLLWYLLSWFLLFPTFFSCE
ncbi:hypothetical protein QBC37DRAFT_147611 [Rhypophila decipiens]|uniref:Uncharacterized protein n=1 Tax=Rhypophila decipiens TaxID=261697 RepID=A0AAN6Y8Y1_9PEZI|nr:hypothetical protein QBC37DRAFT_147611 [Rhypophila decipiens]